MAAEARKNQRKRVAMTVRYRTATLGGFIEEQSHDVSDGGTFIETPAPHPPGTLLKFEIKVAEEQLAMRGVGRVVWSRDESGGRDDPAGMGVKFIKIDAASRAVIARLIEDEQLARTATPAARPAV
jgi:uncharacterized protein (TIGR02266 family)